MMTGPMSRELIPDLTTEGKRMPKIKTAAGKTKKFPYTKKGKADAKKAAKKGGKMMMTHGGY